MLKSALLTVVETRRRKKVSKRSLIVFADQDFFVRG